VIAEARAGVDTWSVCWTLNDGSPAHRAIEELATEPGPRSKWMPEAIEGHRIGYFPAAQLLVAEGHPSSDGLASAVSLEPSLAAIVRGLHSRGVPVPHWRIKPVVNGFNDVRLPVTGGSGFAGVRRLDSTVDLRFENPLHGLVALAGVAALPLPRTKKKTIRETGGNAIETVYLLGYAGKRVLGRWYDKGIERGAAPRGEWVRPEDQRRFAGGHRPPVEAMARSGYIRDAFVRRFEPLWKASKGVTVGGALELAKRLGRMVDAGEISPTTAKRIAGHLVLDAAGEQKQAKRTILADRRDARNLGLVLADGVLDEVEIDLGEVCEAAMDSAAWGAQG
jgi:hypothetical protein